MTGTQLQRAAFNGESQHGKRRLRVLIDRKLIYRLPYAKKQFDKTESFNFDGYVYQLTDLGVAEVERMIGDRVLTADDRSSPSVAANVEPRKIARYLQCAEVYLHSREEMEWIPHYLIRHRLQTDDFTIGCIASIDRKGNKGILFGTNKSPHLNTLKAYRDNIKNAVPLGLSKSIIMCPDSETVAMAVNYYQGKSLDGEVFVMTYEDAQEDLPFVMESRGYYRMLVNELRSRYGKVPVIQVSGRYPISFDWMIEYQEGVYGYLADVSAGNLEVLYDLLGYNYSEAKNEEIHNEGFRVVFALVRDQRQLEWLKPQLDHHPHVRLIVRKTDGEPHWYGNRDGEWYQVQRTKKQSGVVAQ